MLRIPRHLSLQVHGSAYRFSRLISNSTRAFELLTSNLQPTSTFNYADLLSSSNNHNNNNSSDSGNKALSREELHRLALTRNREHQRARQQAFDAETNIAMTAIPRDIKFAHTDSLELRDWKRRQQYYYFLEQRYGFLNDILAKLGLVEQKEIDEKREWLKQRLKSTKWISDESRKSSISLRALSLVQQEHEVPSEMLIAKEDSLETKQDKVKQQLNYWVTQTTESLDALPNDAKSVTAAIKEAKLANRLDYKVSTEDIEIFLLEHEEELKQELEWSDEKFVEFAIHARNVAARIASQQTVDSLVKTGPLDKLQLISPHSLEKVERALKEAGELYTKRAQEFEMRFGSLPLKFENDPYMLEEEAQLQFVASRPALIIESNPSSDNSVAATQEAVEAEETKTEEVAKAAEEESEVVEGEEESNVLGPNEVDEYDILTRSESDEEDDDMKMYRANRKQATFLSSIEEDGEQWPRIVDGIDLTNPSIQRIRDFDYDKFEEPPTPLEIRILDAFAVQRQLRHAQKNNITLIPRVHIPYTPADRSYIAKTLLMYRINALHTHIQKLKMDAKVQYDKEYRDISKLNLKLPYDPLNPWKQDIFDQLELVLKNQGNWTTGQKEDCMVKLHRMLTDDTFSKESQELAQL